eukprot:229743_1
MSLSDRFENIPTPRYETMEIKANGTNIRRSNVKGTNVFYDEAIIASEPKIIRPNVSNLILSKKQAQPQIKNNAKIQKNKTKRNNNATKRNQHQKGSNNNTSRFNRNTNTNRGRGYRSNNNFQTNSFQTQQNGFHLNGGGGGGYKSFRTSNGQPRQPMNHTPYKRPTQKQTPKVRQLPTYQTAQNNVYNRSKSNGFHRNQNRNANTFNNNQYLLNKRQNYYNQRNNNDVNNQRLTRNNNTNKQRNTIGNRNRNGNNKASSFKQKTNFESLDRELDAYNMKNPNVEDRNHTISANLDKELDDYFQSQSDENATSSNNNANKE